jgi:peptidoglycan/xylan/chitin deacetylase (PgdA/CDA1 family)
MEIARRAKVAGGKVARRFASNGLILMYHRVAHPDTDPWGLCVTAEHFAEQLQVLKDNFNIVALRDLGRALRNRRIADRTIAISFDDGYADNFHNALPQLDADGLPATIFISTGNLAREREFWWDELEQILLNDRLLPERLTLVTRDGERTWHVTPGDYSESLKSKRAWEGEPGTRVALFHDIWKTMLCMPSDEQDSVIDQLVDLSESPPTLRPSHRSLTEQEIHTLAQHRLIDIGAHTVSHPLLTAHSETFQRREIEDSKAQLEDLTGTKISCFAYPFGDHSESSVRLTHKAGFECACTTVENTVWRFSDPYRMPRLAVEDWDGDQFAKQLHRLLGRR